MDFPGNQPTIALQPYKGHLPLHFGIPAIYGGSALYMPAIRPVGRFPGKYIIGLWYLWVLAQWHLPSKSKHIGYAVLEWIYSTDMSRNERTGIALFGLGRSGQIHLGNLVKIPRCDVLYVIEANVEHATDVLQRSGITDTQILSVDDVDVAYADDR